jgi:hypothetical protein
MKKNFGNYIEITILIIAFALGLIGIISCSSDDINDQFESVYTTSECYIGDRKLTSRKYPTINKYDNVSYFYLRIDNRIPGTGSYSASMYYPYSNRGSVKDECNKGSVNLDYSNWNYQDATYYSGSIQYVYDTSGSEVLKTIKTEPDWKNILDYSGITVNPDTLKVLWYITKYEDGFWHTDGILTGISTKDISEVPGIDIDKTKVNKKDSIIIQDSIDGHIEVDIYNQQHSSWSEIKTSVHIRALIDSIRISIPIEANHVCEADDMTIRYYEYFGNPNNIKSYVQIKIEHSNYINITIKVNPDYIRDLLNIGGDGLTIELHNYIKDLTNNEIWDLIKDSNIETFKVTIIKYRIADYIGHSILK